MHACTGGWLRQPTSSTCLYRWNALSTYLQCMLVQVKCFVNLPPVHACTGGMLCQPTSSACLYRWNALSTYLQCMLVQVECFVNLPPVHACTGGMLCQPTSSACLYRWNALSTYLKCMLVQLYGCIELLRVECNQTQVLQRVGHVLLVAKAIVDVVGLLEQLFSLVNESQQSVNTFYS